jgi:serine/threonine-protein kinase
VDTAAHLNAALAGRYEIIREAGAGGMATVFLARDVRHDRQVAIKVLREDLAASLGAERFLREVRIAAQLQHPHILPVFDSGDADGTLWYAMPFVEGETLRDKLARDGALPIGDAIRLIREVADALAKAHAAGVVHRDIKPENILLADGHALVADFGVAKALTAASTSASPSGGGLTTAGMSLGTPGYMAPEQVAADPAADHRTDIYSLGIVAWEALVGKAPFAHLPPAQQLAAQVTTVPEPLSAKRTDCPPALADAIARCLAKVPGDRPRTADELKVLLDGASGAYAASVAGVGKFGAFGAAERRSPAALAGRFAVFAVAVVIVVGAMLLALRWTHKGPKADAAPSLAVLPFENLQGDSATAYFGDGIAEEIIGTVSRLPGLQVASRSVSFRHRGADVDVKRVGRELGVTHLLEGSVQRAGKRVRVNVRLTNVASGFSAWSERFDRDLTDIFAVEDEIAAKVASALDVRLGVRQAATAGATANVEAHDQYLLGLKARNERDLRTASERFARAIALDSGYAAAHAALASVLVLYPEYGLTSKPDSAMFTARAAAGRALALDSTQAAAHLALAYAAKVHGRDFAGAEREYRHALALDDNDAQAHHWHGELLMELGKFEEARAEFTKSVKLDPTAPASLAMLAMAEFRIAGQGGAATVDSAQAICGRVTQISPLGGVFPFEFACGTALARAKRFDAARPHLVLAGRAVGDSALFMTTMDGVRDGARRGGAVAIVDRKMAAGGKLEPVVAAAWYMLLSEPDRAVGALEKAERTASPFGSFLEVLDFSALPDSPRMRAVRKKLGYGG